MAQQTIPTYIISLDRRIDRRMHIINQFQDKNIFDWKLVSAIENKNGRLGLWLTIKDIVKQGIENKHKYILICEDDHQFTPNYSDLLLFDCIKNAEDLGADILLGGICFCDPNVKQVNNNLLAITNFACTQFLLVFNHFFDTIITSEFSSSDCADLKLATISNNKMVVYPFISIQKDFGYSDVSDGYHDSKMLVYFSATSNFISDIIKNKKF